MKISRLKVVLDTNVLLVSLPRKSQFRPIFDRLLHGEFDLAISNDIQTEYEEIIAQRYDAQTVKELFDLFSLLPNVVEVTPYFKWNLIKNDPDDNKFVDAAVAVGADLLVSNDKHFKILKQIAFPHLTVCRAETFMTYF